MAGFDVGQALNMAGGLGKLGATWAGAYMGGPKAASNEGHLKKAGIVGNWRYGASDMAGLMSQWENTPQLQNVNYKDFFDPSAGEMFGHMFGSGMASYSAMGDLTKGLKGKLGSTQVGGSSGALGAPVQQDPTTSEMIAGAGSREEQFDIAEGTATNPLEAGIYKDMSAGNPTTNQGSLLALQQTNPWETGFQGFACGGHMHGCGGHKFAGGGGISFDWGSGVGTALNLASGAVGVGLAYAGMKAQQDKAKMEAKEVNAMNLYARQLQQHNFDEAVTDSKNNMFNQQALQMMALGGNLFGMGGDMQTHGAEFPLDGNFNIIGAGGTHEQSPFGGVYQGMALDGKPNLVEEDEVVWNDYVFSNRLTIPKEFAKARKLKEGITYADAAKRLSKEAEERANDVISQNGLAESLGALMESQEELKQKREATRVKRAIAKMSPEEVMGMMAALNGGQPDVFAEGGLLSHQFDGKSSTTGKMSRRAKKAAAEAKAKQEHGLYESGVGNLNSEWLKYIASQIEGFDANKYKYAGADADIRQFVLDNYDKLGGWEGLNQAFRRGSQMPLLAENSPLRNYRYTEREGYSMTPEQWNTFFDSLNAYRESRKAGNTSGKYHADSNFDNSGKTAAQVEQDPRYQAFKRYVREQATKYANGEQADENALRYLRTLDEGINTSKGAQRLLEYNPDGSVKMVDSRMQLRQGWEADYDKRNYDQIGGIYHFYTDTPDVTKTKTGERHIVRLNGEEIEITPEEMARIGRFTHGDNYISQVTEKDENGNDVTTHYYDYESPEVQAEYTPEETPEKQPPLPTWMRYAPLLSGLGALQGPAKDYSTAVSPITAHYAPIGDYLPYLPVDTQRYINAENQQAAAQLNAIMNASAGNRNMAMAQAALANSQRQQGIGQRMQAAEQINWDRLRTAGEFNRGTNMFNAQTHNAAEIANLQVNPLLLRQEQQNQMMKYQADRDRDAAVSESLNAFLDSLGAIGKENLAWNQVNSNEALRYFSDPNWLAAGQSGYKKPTIGKTVTMSVGAPTAEEAAFGGYLLSKPKKNRR